MKNPCALFLVTPDAPNNDNHVRIPQYFAEAGWQVTIAAHEDTAFANNEVVVNGETMSQFNLVWTVGFGPAGSFSDRMQMMQLTEQAKLVTPVNALLNLHGKTPWLKYGPMSLVTNKAEACIDLIETHGGRWVLKPVAGSYGRDVHLITAADEVKDLITAKHNQYWVLQRYLPEITQGETRTLVCANKTIGSYLRVPSDGLHANVAMQADTRVTTLSDAQQHLLQEVVAILKSNQVGFAAIDMVGTHLMEVNLANPGGLQTLCELYGDTVIKQRMISAMTAWHVG